MEAEVKIKRIELSEISDFLAVLKDAVGWLSAEEEGCQWDDVAISTSQLLDEYGDDDIYVGYADEVAVCSVVVQKLDTRFWPHIKDDSSLFIHKLAVTKPFRGSGLSTKMINLVVDLAREQGRKYVRLDCVSSRDKLCDFYRQQGFVKIGVPTVREYNTALFELEVN